MVRRRFLTACLVFSVAVFASFGVSFATTSSGSHLGSFYGGYHHVNLSSRENSSLRLQFHFRTASYESGLLFLAVQRSHNGYLAAGLRDGAVDIVLKLHNDSPQTLFSFNLSFQNTSLSSPSNWHSLSVQYHQFQLSVTLDSSNIHSQTLTIDEGFSEVYFAGMDSFQSHSLFHDLSLAQFFIGCLANVTVDLVPVSFVSDHQNGLGTECCPIPRTPMWCFQYSHSNLSIPTSLLDSTSIQISFDLQAFADGLVLSTELNLSHSLHLQLSGQNLSLVISNSQEGTVKTLDCPSLHTEGDWYTVEIALTSETARCAVGDGAEEDLSTTTQLSLSSFASNDLTLGSADADQTSFKGCIRHFKINSTEIRPLLPGNHLVQHHKPVQWNELNFDLHPLMVDVGERVHVSSKNIRMTLPEEFFAEESAFLYQQDIKRSLLIEAMEGPYQGSFVSGVAGGFVSAFSYDSLTSQDNKTQVFYQHSGISENITDEVVVQVSVECGGSSRILFSGTLEISVIDNMDAPLSVFHNEAISIAAGTRRVITNSHMTVEGRVNRNPNSVTFSLQSIEPMEACERYCDEARGNLFKTDNPNLNVMFFSQDELNNEKISFQHFEKFDVEPVVIKLLASTNGGSINVTIDVHPYKGHITYLTPPGVCLFVKEGSTALLEPKHLNTSTNFEDQDPVVSYDLIQEPRYGYFERYIAYHNIFPDWHPMKSVNPDVSGSHISDVNFFTQEDIDDGRVRYVHNHSSILNQESESFRFRLRSSNLTGDSESLCINIVPEAILVQPMITITTGDIRGREGGEVVINRSLLTTTPSRSSEEFITGAVDIEQMGIIYNLEEVPYYGQLLIGETELAAGDNFTFDEVSKGRLRYVHGGTEDHSDAFRVYAIATTTATLLILTPDPSPVVTVDISITPVNNHLPELRENLAKIRPPEGQHVVITEENILVTDEDRPKEVLNIYIRKKGTAPIGHFAFVNSLDVPISRFTMQNVFDEEIAFVHWLNTSASLEHTQVIRLDDGSRAHYVRRPITIQAVPFNLTVERRDSSCLANIDATLEQLAITVQPEAFSIMLHDHFGEDRDLVPDVNVNISSPPRYGQFRNKAASGELNVNRFTVRNLQQGEIEYRFANQSTTTFSDDFSWTFTYGSSVVGPLQLQICVSPVPIPRIVHVNSISVAFGGMVNLDSNHLLAVDNRGGASMNDTLVYQIITPPQNGSIISSEMVASVNLTNFTQTDLRHRRIIYQNKYSDMSRNMQDSFTFQVCTPYECTDSREFIIHVQFVNLTVLNTGFTVREGDTHDITTEELYIFAPAESQNLRFYITPPRHGNITLRGPGLNIDDVPYFNLEDLKSRHIFYQNDGHENLHDSFEFTATADYLNEASGVYETLGKFTDMVNITIEPVNDNPPEIVLLLEELNAVKDGSTRINSSLLQAHDYDSNMDDVDIEWRLQFANPIYGYLYLDEDRGRSHAITSWKEGDLRSNRLYYRNDGGRSINSDIIAYLITDGFHESSVEYTFINLQDIIFKSKATANGPIEVIEGGNITISTDYLGYCAENDPSLVDDDFLYTVRHLPEHGILLFQGDPLRIGSTFKQTNIGENSLVYINDHSNNYHDSFQYALSVRDRDTSNKHFTFEITVNAIDDDPPEVNILQDPLFVIEGRHVQINSSALDIYDHDIEDGVEIDNLECTVQSPPKYGLLKRNRFGSTQPASGFTKYDVVNNQLWYEHTSHGHYEDSFTFQITDGINPQNETYEVRIVILPYQVTLKVHNITVEEGQLVHLERGDFVLNHPYLNSVPGRFTIVHAPTNGILSNAMTNRHSIDEFTTADLSNDSIVYTHNHNGREIVSDSFQFLYESLQPYGYHRRSAVKTMHISIKPVDDEPPIFGWRLTTDNIISGQELLLDERYLNVTDGDTPPSQLNYTFTLNIRGHIAYSNNTKKSIHWFTQADVKAGRVKFVHEMDLNGNIEFNVTDGKQFAFATLDITTTVLELTCDQSMWSEISVRAGEEVNITSNHIICNIYDYQRRPITFLVGTPRHGYFVIGKERRNNFTMGEVNQNKVKYRHDDFEFWEEERLNASATSDFVEPYLFELVIHINFHHSNTSLLATNKGLQLDEGGLTCLNMSVLDARNLRYSAWLAATRDGRMSVTSSSPSDLVPEFNLTHLPVEGTLLLESTPVTALPASFTHSDIVRGLVCYQHSGSESVKDSVPFRLHFLSRSLNAPLTFSDNQTFLNSIEETISIKITPVNDERPHLVTGRNLMLVLGFTIDITSSELEAIDEDSPPSSVFFTLVSAPESARLLLRGEELQLNAKFNQADVNNGLLRIEPMSSTSQPERFILSFKDEVDMPEPQVMSINYTISKHSLTISTNEEVTYQQNVKEVPITTDHLNTETNWYRSDTHFTVVSGPSNGQLFRGREKAVEFSQLDIDGGKIKYIPNVETLSYEDKLSLHVVNNNIELNTTISFTSLAWGSVREDSSISFLSTSLSKPLPSDLLVLQAGKPPEILVINKPRYGVLEVGPIRQLSNNNFSFHYDDLVRGWVMYTWDYDQPVFTDTVVDNFVMVVLVEDMPPGKANINLRVHPPKNYMVSTMAPSPDVSEQLTDSPRDDSPQTSSNSGGFPLYSLIPILGVFFFLLIMIAVIIVFCFTQQKRIRRKWQPSVAHPPVQHTYPWSVGSHSPGPRVVAPPNYNFDPTSQSGESDNEERNSETSSGFSEPALSPRHSPTQAFSLPAHSQQSSQHGSNHIPYGTPSLVVPARVRSRARSNVSITFSSRQSVASDVSIEDSPRYYSHSLPRPQESGEVIVVPTPVRPASHSAFSRVMRPPFAIESGYNSTTFHGIDDSGVPSRAGSCVGYDDDCDLSSFPSADVDVPLKMNERLSSSSTVLPTSLSHPSEAGPGPVELKSSLAISDELVDPQRLLSPANPVLGKGYWV